MGWERAGRNLNRKFLKEKEFKKKISKKSSPSLTIRKIQIKTLWIHLTQDRTAKINKTINKECWRECRGEGPLIHCWWDSATLEISNLWRMFNLPYDADILLLGRCPKRPTSYLLHRHVLSMFMAGRCSTHIARKWKQLTCPSSGERTMKMCCIYTMER